MFSHTLHPNTRTAWLLITLSIIFSVSMATVLHQPAQTSDSTTNHKDAIFYTQFDGNSYDVVMLDSDGVAHVLTDSSSNDWAAQPAPNSDLIYFISDRSGMAQIYSMTRAGTQVQAITPLGLDAGSPEIIGMPSFTAGGSKMAFTANLDGNWDIFVMTLANGNLTRLTTDAALDANPQFSPDGSQILFHSLRDGNYNLYIMDSDGSNERPLTFDGTVMDAHPAWSPDGRYIAFHSERDGDSEIFIMNADGSDVRQMTFNNTLDRAPRFSADGRTVLYRSNRDGNSNIYALHLNSGCITRITISADFQMYPNS